MRVPLLIGVLVLGAVFFVSCNKFEFDPNQTSTSESEHDLNNKNINKILSDQGDSIVTIALIGDSHVYYESFDEVIEQLNGNPEIDFIVHAGDISDHGYVQEFERGAEYLEELHKPSVVVIGNHDLVAKGFYVYKRMFGVTNFSFVYKGVKFIFFDSNGREYGFPGNIPDVSWIKKEIQSDTSLHDIVLVSHVPYFNSDYDTKVLEPYAAMLTSEIDNHTIISLSGHQHGSYEVMHPDTGVPHLGSGSTKEGEYYIIRINKGKITYEKHSY